MRKDVLWSRNSETETNSEKVWKKGKLCVMQEKLGKQEKQGKLGAREGVEW